MYTSYYLIILYCQIPNAELRMAILETIVNMLHLYLILSLRTEMCQVVINDTIGKLYISNIVYYSRINTYKNCLFELKRSCLILLTNIINILKIIILLYYLDETVELRIILIRKNQIIKLFVTISPPKYQKN